MNLLKPTRLKSVTGVSGKSIPILGRAPVDLTIGNELRLRYESYVIKDLPFGSILGLDQLVAGKARIDLGNNVIHLHGKSISFGMKPSPLCAPAEGVVESYSEKEEILRSSCGANLTEEEKNEAVEMMMEREGAFSWKGEIGRIRNPLVKLELIAGAKPVATKPYRYSDVENEALDTQVKEWMEKDIVEECHSPFNSPLVVHVGGHHDETPRICLDAREISKILIQNRYPMTDMDRMLEKLSGRKYYAVIDVRRAFHHLEFWDEESKAITAFCVGGKQYRFKRLPFGTCNSSAIFQNIINEVLGDLLMTGDVHSFVDDIAVAANDFHSLLKDCGKVFDRLGVAGFKMSPKKCLIGLQEVCVLGHLLSAEGIRPNPSKVKAIHQIATPTNVKELQSLLGLVSYFRKFIESFALIAQPLTTLLKSEIKWEWTEEQQTAVEILAHYLTKPPILVPFNPKLPIAINVDGSGVGIGACLGHEVEGRIQPVYYVSRTLNQQEQNYSICEIELLAVIFALKKLRHFVFGREFNIYTDHIAIASLKFAKKQGHGRIIRWAMQLLEFPGATIIYRAGKLNFIADALSRLPLDEQENSEDEDSDLPSEIPILAFNFQEGNSQRKEDFISLQGKDPFCLNTKHKLDQGNKQAHSKFTWENGILFNRAKGLRRPVIPKCLIGDVLHNSHCNPDSGHTGFDKTWDRIRKRYYFKHMYKNVLNYVNGCDTCKICKHRTTKLPGLGEIIEYPKEILSCYSLDLCGPFKRAQSDNVHVISAVDTASKYLITKAVPDATAETIIKFIKEDIILRFGIPTAIITDRATTLLGKKMDKFLKQKGIKHQKTTFEHSASNGVVERSHRSYVSCLKAFISENQEDWDEKLSEVTFALNSTVSKSIKASPSFLIFGVEARLPIQNKIPRQFGAEETHLKGLEEQRLKAWQENRKTQIASKKRIDKKRIKVTYNPGDEVAIYHPYIRKGLSRKLVKTFRPGFTIAHKVSNLLYKVVDANGLERVVNIQKMKKLNPNNKDEFWIENNLIWTGSEDESSPEEESKNSSEEGEYYSGNSSEGSNDPTGGEGIEEKESGEPSTSDDEDEGSRTRPRRDRKRPRWHKDYVMVFVVHEGEGMGQSLGGVSTESNPSQKRHLQNSNPSGAKTSQDLHKMKTRPISTDTHLPIQAGYLGVIIMCTLAMCFQVTQAQAIYQPRIGLFHEEVPHVIMYNFYVPLLFELPGVTSIPMAGLPKERYCVERNFFEKEKAGQWHASGHKTKDGAWKLVGSRLCFMVNKIYDLLEEKRSFLRLFHDDIAGRSGSAREKRGLFNFVGNIEETLFGNPSSSTFEGMTMEVRHLEAVVNHLRQNDPDKLIHLSSDVSHMSHQVNISLQVVQKEMDDVNRAYQYLQKEFDGEEMAILGLSAEIGDLIRLSHSETMHQIYLRGKDQCQNRRVADFFMRESVLRNDLENMARNLAKRTLKLAIPMDRQGLYYQLPLADCGFAKEKGIMKVQVPVAYRHDEWKLLLIKTLPYSAGNHTCHLDLQVRYIAVNGATAVPLTSEDLPSCNPETFPLCRIAQPSMMASREARCVRGIIGGMTVDQLQKVCPFSCDEHRELIITWMSSRRFAITNLRENSGVIQCPDKKDQILMASAYGTLEVKIPCNCRLLIDSIRRDYDSIPCMDPELFHTGINLTLPVYYTDQFADIVVSLDKPVLIPSTHNITLLNQAGISPVNLIPPLEKGEEDDDKYDPTFPGWIENQWTWTTTLGTVWLSFLTLICLFLWLRHNSGSKPMIPVAAVTLGSLLQKVEAGQTRRKDFCFLPPHVEAVLWGNTIWLILLTAPFLIMFFFNKMRKWMRQRKLQRNLKRRVLGPDTMTENQRLETTRIESALLNSQRYSPGDSKSASNPPQGSKRDVSLNPATLQL